MITYGIVLIVIAIIAWAVGAALPNRIALIAGKALGAIGAILLIVGVILYVFKTGALEVDALAMLR